MRILIGIHGSHETSARMQAQRDTWIPLLDPKSLHYRYFVGQPMGQDQDAEYVNFDDGPVWITRGPVSSRTPVLNLRTRALLDYALENGYDYVFKIDDDTYVRPDLLLGSGFEQYDYSGSCEEHHADDIGNYRYAGGGGGYWLSRRAMRAILESRICHCAEDCNAGQVLARAGIPPHHDLRYLNAVTEEMRMNPPADAITLHKCDPDQMRIVHQALYPSWRTAA